MEIECKTQRINTVTNVKTQQMVGLSVPSVIMKGVNSQ